MDAVLSLLSQQEIPFVLESFSALDRYFHVREPGPVHIRTEGSLVDLARLFDTLSFPGTPDVDAATTEANRRYLFRCVDDSKESSDFPYTAQDLLYDSERNVFKDPQGIYGDLRRERLVPKTLASSWSTLSAAARLVSRYHYELEEGDPAVTYQGAMPPKEEQRQLLIAILASRYPDKGLTLLDRAGLVEACWPEMGAMKSTVQSKEHHPEGDVWEHTLATLRNRKTFGPILGLGLLLHDVGKPRARRSRSRAFDSHSELGAQIATRFLGRLGFEDETIRDVGFLVRHHMMPAALAQLPLYRTERLMESPLFPDLLELYRADIVSTYRQPSNYYEACRIYKRFMKKKGNPYREPVRSLPPG